MCRDKITIKGTGADRIQYRECNNDIIYYYDNKIYYSLLLEYVHHTHSTNIQHVDLTPGTSLNQGDLLPCVQTEL